MATVVDNGDGTATVTLSLIEQDTVSGLAVDQLQNYLTLWLKERATQVFQERFAKLSLEDQGDVLTKFRSTI